MVDLFTIHGRYFTAATLGAHSNFGTQGFRPKDVRFYLGLFLNWVDSTTKGADESVHNTQISRYLDGLTKAGFATKSGPKRSPKYQLTRLGLLDQVGKLMKVPISAPLERFFFVYYFAKTYGGRIVELVEQKESGLPRSLKIELEALLDPKELLVQQFRFVQLEIRKLESRIKDTEGAATLARKLINQNERPDEIVRAVERQFPYDLNSAKPMSELMGEVPPELRAWELTTGNENRAALLWASFKSYLEGYLEVLGQLEENE